MSAPPARSRPASSDGGLLLCRVAGVPVLLSPSWWVGAVLIVLVYAPLVTRILPGAGALAGAVIAAVFAVLLAVSVLLHELGHCLVALRLGVPVRRVRLFLLGGISEMPRNPASPAHEGLIAAAGPAVSLGLAAVAGIGWLAAAPHGAIWLLIAQTCVANLVVAVFNLLPGLPLDGGRMLRSLLWAVSGRRHWGTNAAVAGAGLVALGLFGYALAGLFTGAADQWLRLVVCLFMAWFVVAGAGAEHSAEQRRGRPVRLALPRLIRPVLQLPAESPVGDALAAAAGRGVVLVRADGIAVGLLDRAAAERLAARSPHDPAERAAEPVEPDTILLDSEPAEAVLERVRTVRAWQFLVIDDEGRPRGVLRREDVRNALRRR